MSIEDITVRGKRTTFNMLLSTFNELKGKISLQNVAKDFKYTGLTLPFAIVAICYKNDRVATDLNHWRKVQFRQIKSPFSPILVQNLLTGDLYVNTCIQLCRDFQYWPDWVT